MSNKQSDFISLEPSKAPVQGIGSGLNVKGIGTLRWKILDDYDREITLYIGNALYVPEFPMNLFSPQHVAQQAGHATDGFNAKAASGTLHFEG